jgi:hypothetical protein
VPAAAEAAVQNDRLILGKLLVARGQLRIGAEFRHAARDVDGTSDPAARRQLGTVTQAFLHQALALKTTAVVTTVDGGNIAAAMR